MKHRFDSVLNAVTIRFPDVQRGGAWFALRALALAAVAAAGIAVGRWVVPAGDGVSSASLEVTESNPAAPLAAGSANTDGLVTPDRILAETSAANTDWLATPDRILAEARYPAPKLISLPTLGPTPDRILAETGKKEVAQ